MSTLFLRVSEGRNLRPADRNGLSDPYAVIRLDGKQKQSTRVISKELNPVWHEDFSFKTKGESRSLHIQVFDKDLVGAGDFLGEVEIDLRTLELPLHRWFNLNDRKQTTGQGKILVSLVQEPKDPKNVPAGLNKDQTRRFLIDQSVLGAPDPAEVGVEAGIANLDLRTSEEIKVWVGTWNLGNVPPSDSAELRLWMRPGADIYAVGVQECLTDDWEARILDVLNGNPDEEKQSEGDQYILLESQSLMKIKIHVFVRRRHREFIHHVQSGREATGFASVVGNKGGVCVSFYFHDTSLAFLNCHLAAHQEKVERRNADMKEIVGGIKLGEKHVDILNQFDHLIWLGDLNYRVEWGPEPLERIPTQEVFEEMVQMIEDGKFEPLYEKDQLVREIKAGNAFRGFVTPPCNFVPTFKVKNGEYLTYNPKRVPSWCDRILTRSLCPDNQPKLLAYDSVPKVLSSDHKPVYAEYQITVADLPPAVDVRKGRLSFRITNLKARDIPAMDHGGTSDPFIVFLAPYLPDKKYKTPHLPKTLTPEWDDSQVPLLESSCNNAERLKLQPLKLKMYDHDTVRSEVIGTAVLRLTKEMESGEPHPFEATIERGGQLMGSVSGQIQFVYAEKNLGK